MAGPDPAPRPEAEADPATLPPPHLVADMAALAAAEPLFAEAARAAVRFVPVFHGPGFMSLLRQILAQQVSTAAATAMGAKLARLLPAGDAAGFLALADDSLAACGFSRQKRRYARALADSVCGGALDLAALAGLDDDEARARLTALPGIGPWTADCYLLFAEGRRDLFPAADLALQVGWQRLLGLPQRPSAAVLAERAADWQPLRSAAALLIWKSYLAAASR